jgi:hypothetical protein
MRQMTGRRLAFVLLAGLESVVAGITDADIGGVGREAGTVLCSNGEAGVTYVVPSARRGPGGMRRPTSGPRLGRRSRKPMTWNGHGTLIGQERGQCRSPALSHTSSGRFQKRNWSKPAARLEAASLQGNRLPREQRPDKLAAGNSDRLWVDSMRNGWLEFRPRILSGSANQHRKRQLQPNQRTRKQTHRPWESNGKMEWNWKQRPIRAR